MAPRDNLTRQVDFTITRADADDDGLTLEGYAAVFNSPTLIDSWEGRFEEIIAPGAFKRTIDRKGAKGIRLQFDHGTHPLIGSIPIGVNEEVREDARGLFVRARLHDNWLIQPVRDAIREGSVHGMSFRFRIVREEEDVTDPDLPVRTVHEVELFELGPVVWPAYEKTSVGVRAREIAETLMDPEQRAEIARALLIGTSEEPAQQGTSEEPAEEERSEEPVVVEFEPPDGASEQESGTSEEPVREDPPEEHATPDGPPSRAPVMSIDDQLREEQQRRRTALTEKGVLLNGAT